MAAAVARVFGRGGVLLAEAGTGTGKTLAYLTPAVLSGHRVVVSTGTKNLQEQIYFKDIPLLREALGVPFTAACMKGRGNYLCLHRFAAMRDDIEAGSPADRVYLEMVDDWAAATDTGDRAELGDLPEDVPFWAGIAATNENCIGSDCPEFDDCFVTRMRQRAAASDVVIVNHHLLCADAAVRQGSYGEVIPECAYAVIDEAHQLEDVATQYFGFSVSNYRVTELVRDFDRVLAGGGVADDDGELGRAMTRIDERARLFFGALALARPATPVAGAGMAGNDDRVRVTAADLEPAQGAGASLLDALDALVALVALVKQPSEDLGAIGRRAAEIGDELRFLLRAGDRDYVYYLEQRGRGVFLRASPINVSSLVRNLLLDRFAAAVLTSATLAVDGSFSYVRSRLGVERCEEIRLASEFDFATQALLYLPKRMPSPKTAEFAHAAGREVLDILRRTKGRAFVLFTSYAVLRTVQAALDGALDTRCSSRAARRGRRCSPSSDRRRTPSCWRPRVSGRGWTSSATPSAASSSTGCRSRRPAIQWWRPGSKPSPRGAATVSPISRSRSPSWRCCRASAGSSATGGTGVCWPSSIRAYAPCRTGAGSSRRCRRRR